MQTSIWRIIRMLGVLALTLILPGRTEAQSTGMLSGVISDGATGDPLSFATVGISALGIGATSDVDGKYRLTGIPSGTYSVIVNYMGYRSATKDVSFAGAQSIALDFDLLVDAVLVEEVVVSAQASGQAAAINQQVNSNTIVNVVSREKLQELPDQNAAEAVGRLAGVSVQRDAGEGQKVVIRGLSPRFNAITVNGERLPSTDPNDRSVDLSMISPDMLAGIELFKALRPDMDGDAIGGSVNFAVRKADRDPKGSIRAMGSYNDLRQDAGLFRINGDYGRRFLDRKLGVLLSGQAQRANRGAESILASYIFEGIDQEGNALLPVDDATLSDKLEIRNRYGAGATLDYEFNQQHAVLYNATYGLTDQEELRYRRRYRPVNNNLDFDVRQRNRKIGLFSQSLSGEHIFGRFEFTWRASTSSSLQREPETISGRFREIAAVQGRADLYNGPDGAILGFKNDLSNTILYDSRISNINLNEKNRTFQADIKRSFVLTKKFSGFVKMGLKYRRTTRENDNTEYLIRPYLPAENPARSNPAIFPTNSGGQILIAPFLGDYANPGFLKGEYDLLPGTPELRATGFQVLNEKTNASELNRILGTNFSSGDTIFYRGNIDFNRIKAFSDAYRDQYRLDPLAEAEDYTGNEQIYAGYVMAELNFGSKLMLMGGIRTEETRQAYTSVIATPSDEAEAETGFVYDVAASQGYREWLPMVHARYKVTNWFDVRTAATKALARPNFFSLVPWQRINNNDQIIDQGKPDLKHTTSWNYDIFASFYNKFGLFTVGGFYKSMDNIDYIGSSIILEQGSRYRGYSLNSPANVPLSSTVRGIEFDLQGNLRPLKGFVSGFVFGANLTLLKSRTYYPLFEVRNEFIPTPPFFITTVTDTIREGRIPGQADIIINGSLGYERKGFSGRISCAYQYNALNLGSAGGGFANAGVGARPEQDSFDEGFLRFDVAVTQKMDKKGRWTVVANLNNLTDNPERARLQYNNLLQEREFYGFTADLGFVYKFHR